MILNIILVPFDVYNGSFPHRFPILLWLELHSGELQEGDNGGDGVAM